MRTVSGTMRTVIPVRPGKQLLQPVADLLAERIGHARSQIRQCVVVHYPPYLTVIDTEIAFLPHVKKTYIKRVARFQHYRIHPRYLKLGCRKTVTQMPCTAGHNFIRAESHLKLSSFPVNTSFRNIQLPLINGIEVTGQGSFEELLPHWVPSVTYSVPSLNDTLQPL